MNAYKLCLAEPTVVRADRVAFTSVTGKPSTMAKVTWFSYVVLPQ